MHLYKQNETLGITFFQLPMTLFANTKYRKLSLQAKVAYGLMLNRLQLSSINGWVNENKEVYIIYTREQLAEQLNLSYKSVVAVFKELKEFELIQEQRRGNGLPNHIYLSKAEVSEQEAKDYCEASRCEEMTGQDSASDDQNIDRCEELSGQSDRTEPMSDDAMPDLEDRDVNSSDPDVSKGTIKTCKNDRSGCVNSTGLDVKNLHPSYIDFSYKEFNKNKGSDIESSQSVSQLKRLGTKTDEELDGILARCDLEQFPDEEALVLQEAVRRLYYTHTLKIDGAAIPQEQIRSQLSRLDGEVLFSAYDKLKANAKPIRNSTKYIMTVIYNAISELHGDLLVDPYLNFLGSKEVKKC